MTMKKPEPKNGTISLRFTQTDKKKIQNTFTNYQIRLTILETVNDPEKVKHIKELEKNLEIEKHEKALAKLKD